MLMPFFKIVSCGFLIFLVVLCQRIEGQSNKVSPKLDFDDAEGRNNNNNNNNTNMSNMPGIGQGRSDGQNTAGGSGSSRGGDGSGSRDGSSTTGSGGSGSSKSGPKIHGVRVTVDTGDTQKSKESKESVEITDVGKHKKRVGIHTDITFEITADGDDDGNATSSAQREKEEEDASVPIYKGRGGSTHKSRHRPHDPKTYWAPSFSAERRGYDGNGRGGSSYAGYYPQYPHNVPVYAGIGDNRHSGGSVGGLGGSTYRRSDGWNSYVPMSSIWTTERTYSERYRPNAVTGYRAPSWKPCYCISSGVDNRRRRESSQDSGQEVMRPTSSVIEVVDGKLDKPFSRQ